MKKLYCAVILGVSFFALTGASFASDEIEPNKEPKLKYISPKAKKCFVDKDGNGICDKSVADGGKCKSNHAVKPKDKSKSEKEAKPDTNKKTQAQQLCPGAGLCALCGLCDSNSNRV